MSWRVSLADDEFTLRPVEPDDKGILLAWRNSDRVRKHMFSTELIETPDHDRWFSTVALAEPDRHLIFLQGDRRLGFISFKWDATQPGTIVWGLYIGEPDAPRGSGTALGKCGLDYAFGTLGANVIRSEAMASNRAAIELYRRLGFTETDSRFIVRGRLGGSDEAVLLFEISR